MCTKVICYRILIVSSKKNSFQNIAHFIEVSNRKFLILIYNNNSKCTIYHFSKLPIDFLLYKYNLLKIIE